MENSYFDHDLITFNFYCWLIDFLEILKEAENEEKREQAMEVLAAAQPLVPYQIPIPGVPGVPGVPG